MTSYLVSPCMNVMHDEFNCTYLPTIGEWCPACLKAYPLHSRPENKPPTVTYSAGWNLPGCLPESDPYVTTEWEDARDSLLDELGRVADDAWTLDPQTSDAIEDADSAIADLKALRNGATFLTYVDGYAYWIEVVA